MAAEVVTGKKGWLSFFVTVLKVPNDFVGIRLAVMYCHAGIVLYLLVPVENGLLQMSASGIGSQIKNHCLWERDTVCRSEVWERLHYTCTLCMGTRPEWDLDMSTIKPCWH